MNTTIPKVLRDILLRRKSKVIIDKNGNICDDFKNNIIKRINEIAILKNCCEIENVDENSVTINVKSTSLKFVNGELENYVNEIENFKSEYDIICTIIKEETQNIQDRMALAISFNENIHDFGYSMDEKLFRVVSTFDKEEIKQCYNDIIPCLQELVGANVVYKPLYPNFPDQVIEMKNIQLYLNAILHYWTDGKYIPYTEVTERDKKPMKIQYKNITVGEEKDIHELMYNLMNAAEAISETDAKDLSTYFTNYKDFIKNIPENITNKENLAITANLIITHCDETPMDLLINKFSTVTDVLRLAAAMSGESPALTKVKFKSFSNKERRILMQLLNNCGNRLEDLFRHKGKWERVCERIHPGKFKNMYPDLVDDLLGVYKYKKNKNNFKKEIENYKIILEVYKENPLSSIDKAYTAINNLIKIRPKIPETIFKMLSDNKIILEDKKKLESIDITTIKERIEQLDVKLVEVSNDIKEFKQTHQRYATKVEETLNKKEFDNTLKLLSQRPGIFSRRLDELLSKVNDDNKVLKYFEEIASKVSVKVLLSLKGYFQNRSEELKVRVFLIKGEASKLYSKTKVKSALNISLCEKICTICDQALINHFKDKSKLNKVYLNEKLKKYIIPLDIRSASSALETYSKGSRFDLSYKKLTDEEQKILIKDLENELFKNENLLKDKSEQLDQLQNQLKQLENKSNNEKNSEEEKNKQEKEKSEINKAIENINENIKILNIKTTSLKSEIKFAKSCEDKKNTNKVRLFIWWTNTKDQRIDIDLSVMIYNEDFQSLGHVSYTALTNDTFKIVHSGDIVDGGDINGPGASEFIDFDPEQITKNGGRYIACSVISFCGITFKNLDNIKFGWMEREDLKSNELFEPKTVRQRLDLNVDSTSTTPVVFDCKTKEIVWIDTTLTSKNAAVNIENSKKPMNALLYYYMNPLKDNMYDLLSLHIRARGGTLVDSEDELSEGDIAFVPYLPYKCKEGIKYICPTDLDVILSEYMTSSCN